MPKAKSRRKKTKYPGVWFEDRDSDRHYYVVFRRKGSRKQYEIAVGPKSLGMQPRKANKLRMEYIDGKLTPKEQRYQDLVDSMGSKGRSFGTLFDIYASHRTEGHSLANDVYRFDKYIRPVVGDIAPKDFRMPHAFQISKTLKGRSAQTRKHVWNILLRIARYDQNTADLGAEAGLAPQVIYALRNDKNSFIPQVNNDTANPEEFLKKPQVKKYFEVLDDAINGRIEIDPKKVPKESDRQRIQNLFKITARMLKLSTLSGMRRGEVVKLCWKDVDLDQRQLTIRDPKGQKNQVIPINDRMHELLTLIKSESDTNQPGSGDRIFPFTCHIRSIERRANEIKRLAELPKSFRPFHGLRVNYASSLADSGKVPMDHLQKLLTHKDPRMTQRYKHLREKALQESSNVINEIF